MESLETTSTITTQPGDDKSPATVNDKLVEVFDSLPVETKWWIRFYMRLNVATGNGWPDNGLTDKLNDVVLRLDMAEGFPEDHPNADWLQGVVESVDAVYFD